MMALAYGHRIPGEGSMVVDLSQSPRRRRAAQTPACLRGSLPESLAYEDGAKAARYQLSCDVNPHDPASPLYACWHEGYASGVVE